MDNLPAHKSPVAEKAIRDKGAWVLFLPPYSPDLNPIDKAFAKLRAHLRQGRPHHRRPLESHRPKSVISSNPRNATTTSPPPDMNSIENPAL